MTNKADRRNCLLLYFAFALVTSAFAFFLRVPSVKDEIGMFANTAFLAGDDWTGIILQMGSMYWRPGMSVFNVPLYLLFRNDPVLLYRLTGAADMLAVSFLPVFAYLILRKFLKVPSPSRCLLFAAAAAGISSIWLYASYARADVLLILLPWPALYLLMLLAEKPSAPRRALYTVLLVLICVFDYDIHTRGIVLLIACLLICLYMSLRDPGTVHVPALLISLAVLLLCEHLFAAWVKSGTFLPSGSQANTLESFDFSALRTIFSGMGIRALFRILLGWAYNLITSTYGVILIGIAGCFRLLRDGLLRKKASASEQILSAFGLLYFAGCLAMGVLFFYHYAYDFVSGTAPVRGDRLLYGRYMVSAAVPLLLAAFYWLFERSEKRISLKAAVPVILLFAGAAALFFLKLSRVLSEVEVLCRYFISLSAFLSSPDSIENVHPDLAPALLKITVINFLVMLLFLLLSRRGKNRGIAACALILAVSCANFTAVWFRIRLPESSLVYDRVETSSGVIRSISSSGLLKDSPFISVDGCKYDGRFFQFMNPSCRFADAAFFAENQNEFLIVSSGSDPDSLFSNLDSKYGSAGYYLLTDTEAAADRLYIRGDGLASRIAAEGYSVRSCAAAP